MSLRGAGHCSDNSPKGHRPNISGTSAEAPPIYDLENILIIKPSSLGDIVLALPALTALRKNLPEAKITWLIRPEFAPLLKNHPHITAVSIFDRELLGKAWFHPHAFASLLSLIRWLRRSKFDAVIDLQGLFRTASLAWLTGCKKRFGMANARELAHIFYTHKVQQENCIHLVDYYLKIIQTATDSKTKAHFVFPRDPAADDSVDSLLNSHGIKPENYAVFIPGSTHSDKCWPIRRFAALADKISSRFHLSVVAAGTESEKQAIEGMKNLANVPIADLAGRTSISELIALLKAAKIVVTNDTGPGHIAAALRTPLVMIFGRSNPARVAPYSKPQSVVAVEPAGRGPQPDSPDPRYDIKNITVPQVYQKVCEQMDS
ncbi:MAG: lipopolysaccharide heptosyltransferase I [Planctomycetes bacterium]|nr:lipopolysaccharide heptosyltransferase I [Planctomycetota bacterium]